MLMPAAPLNLILLIPPQNFTQVVNANQKYILVNFYTQPNADSASFADAAAQMNAFDTESPDPPVLFAQVDAAQNRQLASRFNVTYTTLIWFVSGQPQPYGGLSLQSDDIFFWLISEIDTATTALTLQVFHPPPSNFKTQNPQATNSKPHSSVC